MTKVNNPPDHSVLGAIAFLREAWRNNDGAEGESVKLVCSELERLRAESSKESAGQTWALPERHVVALWLVRHALIEYAAQRHPQAALLDLCELLSWAVEALPGAANALVTANALAATGGPFRSGDALKLYMQQGPLEPPSKPEGGK